MLYIVPLTMRGTKVTCERTVVCQCEDLIEVVKLLEHRIVALENQLCKIEAPDGSK